MKQTFLLFLLLTCPLAGAQWDAPFESWDTVEESRLSPRTKADVIAVALRALENLDDQGRLTQLSVRVRNSIPVVHLRSEHEAIDLYWEGYSASINLESLGVWGIQVSTEYEPAPNLSLEKSKARALHQLHRVRPDLSVTFDTVREDAPGNRFTVVFNMKVEGRKQDMPPIAEVTVERTFGDLVSLTASHRMPTVSGPDESPFSDEETTRLIADEYIKNGAFFRAAKVSFAPLSYRPVSKCLAKRSRRAAEAMASGALILQRVVHVNDLATYDPKLGRSDWIDPGYMDAVTGEVFLLSELGVPSINIPALLRTEVRVEQSRVAEAPIVTGEVAVRGADGWKTESAWHLVPAKAPAGWFQRITATPVWMAVGTCFDQANWSATAGTILFGGRSYVPSDSLSSALRGLGPETLGNVVGRKAWRAR